MKQVMDGCERNFYRACNLLHKVVYYIHTPPRDVPTVTPTYTARTLLFMWCGTPDRISWYFVSFAFGLSPCEKQERQLNKPPINSF